MDLTNDQPCQKRNGKEISFEFKFFVIEQIANGQIYFPSVNQFASLVSADFSSKKYNYHQKKKTISKKLGIL
jgi:hypothetical protein